MNEFIATFMMYVLYIVMLRCVGEYRIRVYASSLESQPANE